MEQFRVIPQLFFDVISCYMPGLTLVVLIAVALPGLRNDALTHVQALVTQPTLTDGSLAAVAVALVIAVPYVLGALLGWPVHKMELLARAFNSPFKVPEAVRKATTDEEVPLTGAEPFYRLTRVARQLMRQEPSGTEHILLFKWYDHLRLAHPDVGALAAKLRAEMVMYAGLTLVHVMAIAAHLAVYGRFADRGFMSVAVLMALFACLRWWDHSATWQFAVANFYSDLSPSEYEPNARSRSEGP